MRPSDDVSVIRGILLAAGAATRFGSDKLLHPLGAETTVVEAAARHLLAAAPGSIAVVRPGRTELRSLLERLGMEVLVCGEAEHGIGHSVAAGVTATRHACGWVVALGDMPYVRPDTIASIARVAASSKAIGVPLYGGTRGNPVAFGSEWAAALQLLTGDRGARDLIEQHRAAVAWVPVDDPGVLRDIDHPSDLVR